MHKIDDHVREMTLDLDLRPPPRRLRPAHRAARRVRRREGRRRRARGPVGLAGRGAAQAPHHRRRPRRPRGRPRRAARSTMPALAIVNDVLLDGMKVVGDLFGSGEMQLPVRAPERGDDEDRGRAPRAAHGEGRRRRQGHRRARHREGRRPRHRQEPRRHHPHQQRLRGPQHRHQGAAADLRREGEGGERRRDRHERPAREEHADHAREPRGDERPRRSPTSRCSSAAPRSRARTWSATCARCTTAGSSTARTRSRASTRWTPSWRASAAASLDPEFGRALGGRDLPPRKSRARRRRRCEVPARSDVAVDVPVFTPPFLGARVAKGIALDEIAAYINETALFRNQWQFRPDKPRDRRRVQGPHPPDPARAARAGPGRRHARARGRLGLLPGQQRRQRPRRVDRRRAPHRAAAVPLPAPAARTASSASPTSSARSSRGEADYAAFHVVDDGLQGHRARAGAVRRRPVPGVPAVPRPLGGDDRGARRVLAPPHPRGVGLRRRGRPDARRACSASSTAGRATRGATRRVPTSTTRRSSTSCSTWPASA